MPSFSPTGSDTASSARNRIRNGDLDSSIGLEKHFEKGDLTESEKIGLLAYAVEKEKADVVRWMLETAKIDPNGADGIAMRQAMLTGNDEILTLLKDHGGRIETPGSAIPDGRDEARAETPENLSTYESLLIGMGFRMATAGLDSGIFRRGDEEVIVLRNIDLEASVVYDGTTYNSMTAFVAAVENLPANDVEGAWDRVAELLDRGEALRNEAPATADETAPTPPVPHAVKPPSVLIEEIREENRRAVEDFKKAGGALQIYLQPESVLFEIEEVLPDGKTISQAIRDTLDTLDSSIFLIEENQRRLDRLEERVQDMTPALPGM